MSLASTSSNFTEVELRIKCHDLVNKDTFSKSDPQCILMTRNPGAEWVELCRTEKIDNNLNPEFETALRMPFFFQQRQMVRLQVIDCDGSTGGDSLGHYDCRLTQLLGKTVVGVLTKKDGSKYEKSKISVQCEEVSNCKDVVDFRCIKGDMKDKQDYYLVWYRTGEGDPVRIHSTKNPPAKANRGTKRPEFPEVVLSADKLDKGDESRKIIIEVWDWDRIGSNDFLGTCTLSREELLKGGRHQLTKPVMHRKKPKEIGSLTFDYEVTAGYSFIDYLKAGLELNMFTAIDFTGSNGHPADRDSLHAIGAGNQYQQTIELLGHVLEQYDTDGLIEAYGFGAKLPSGRTSHCFPLNLASDGNAETRGVRGVTHHYKSLIDEVVKGNVHLSGPTNFRYFLDRLNHLAHRASEPGKPVNRCYVGIILTDGVISDMAETVQRIVEASHLPVFLIIVGIGEGDPSTGFAAMSALDHDGEPPMTGMGGQKQLHDNVQFVEKRMYSSPAEFTNAVLGELPEQIVRYMKYKGFRPGGTH